MSTVKTSLHRLASWKLSVPLEHHHTATSCVTGYFISSISLCCCLSSLFLPKNAAKLPPNLTSRKVSCKRFSHSLWKVSISKFLMQYLKYICVPDCVPNTTFHLLYMWAAYTPNQALHLQAVIVMLLLLTGHPWSHRSPSWRRLPRWQRRPGGAAPGSVQEASTTQTSGRRCSALPGGTKEGDYKITLLHSALL